MSQTFEQKYGGTEFDPENPFDAGAEAARKALIEAYLQVSKDGHTPQAVITGLSVGIVQILMASCEAASVDERDATIRASLVQMAGPAVDIARAQAGLNPLAEDQ